MKGSETSYLPAIIFSKVSLFKFILLFSCLTHFAPMYILSLSPENTQFSDVFMGSRKGTLGTNGLRKLGKQLTKDLFGFSTLAFQIIFNFLLTNIRLCLTAPMI